MSPVVGVDPGATYEFVFPVIDKTMLISSNGRLHWAVKADRTKYWRTTAMVKARSAVNAGRIPRMSKAAVVVTITWPRKHTRDPGNWYPTAKALVDGLTDAGVWPDDDLEHVVGPDMRGAVDRELKCPRITVAVTCLEAATAGTGRV